MKYSISLRHNLAKKASEKEAPRAKIHKNYKKLQAKNPVSARRVGKAPRVFFALYYAQLVYPRVALQKIIKNSQKIGVPYSRFLTTVSSRISPAFGQKRAFAVQQPCLKTPDFDTQLLQALAAS